MSEESPGDLNLVAAKRFHELISDSDLPDEYKAALVLSFSTECVVEVGHLRRLLEMGEDDAKTEDS